MNPCPDCGGALAVVDAEQLQTWAVQVKRGLFIEQRRVPVRVVACSGCEYVRPA